MTATASPTANSASRGATPRWLSSIAATAFPISVPAGTKKTEPTAGLTHRLTPLVAPMVQKCPQCPTPDNGRPGNRAFGGVDFAGMLTA